jgi:hypothetical protein
LQLGGPGQACSSCNLNGTKRRREEGGGGGVIIKLHYKQIMDFFIHPLKRESLIESQQVKKDKKKKDPKISFHP